MDTFEHLKQMFYAHSIANQCINPSWGDRAVSYLNSVSELFRDYQLSRAVQDDDQALDRQGRPELLIDQEAVSYVVVTMLNLVLYHYNDQPSVAAESVWSQIQSVPEFEKADPEACLRSMHEAATAYEADVFSFLLFCATFSVPRDILYRLFVAYLAAFCCWKLYPGDEGDLSLRQIFWLSSSFAQEASFDAYPGAHFFEFVYQRTVTEKQSGAWVD